MSAIAVRVEIGPHERIAIGGNAVHHAFVDNPISCTLAVYRVAIDQPHAYGLSEPVRPLRIRVNVLAVEFEPELARVVGEDGLVVHLRRRPVQKHLLLDASLLRRINKRPGILEAVCELQRRIGSIEIDSPRADDRQLRGISLLAGYAVTAKEPDRWRLRQALDLTALPSLATAAAASFLAKRRQLAEDHRGDEDHDQ